MGTPFKFYKFRTIPVELLTDFLDNEFGSDDPFSEENIDKTVEIFNRVKKNKIVELERLARFFEVNDVWWRVYTTDNNQNVGFNFDNEKFNTKKVCEKYSIIKGYQKNEHLHLIDFNGNFLLIIEHRSRSPLLRNYFRYIIFPNSKLILVEDKKLSVQTFANYSNNNAFSFALKEKRIRALLIRRIVNAGFTLTSLKVRLTLETTGIEGLSHVVIAGENVIRGLDTLKDRQEKSLDFVLSGPWIGAGTPDFLLEVGKGVRLRKIDGLSLKSLEQIISLKKKEKKT